MDGSTTTDPRVAALPANAAKRVTDILAAIEQITTGQELMRLVDRARPSREWLRAATSPAMKAADDLIGERLRAARDRMTTPGTTP